MWAAAAAAAAGCAAHVTVHGTTATPCRGLSRLFVFAPKERERYPSARNRRTLILLLLLDGTLSLRRGGRAGNTKSTSSINSKAAAKPTKPHTFQCITPATTNERTNERRHQSGSLVVALVTPQPKKRDRDAASTVTYTHARVRGWIVKKGELMSDVSIRVCSSATRKLPSQHPAAAAAADTGLIFCSLYFPLSLSSSRLPCVLFCLYQDPSTNLAPPSSCRPERTNARTLAPRTFKKISRSLGHSC